MTTTRFGHFSGLKSVATVLAATLFLAACEKDADVAPEAPTAAESAGTGDGRPTQPSTPAVIEETEEQIWGAKTQAGLEFYANSDRVFFEFDSSELTADARQVLGRQAEWLNHYSDVRITVEGHCDERGTREYNLALGERRATAVKNYLSALGVRSSRISTISYGKERPAVAGNGNGVWSQNRRGVTKVGR